MTQFYGVRALFKQGRWLEVGTWSEGDVARIAPFEPVEVPVGRLFLPPETRPEG